MFLPARFWPLVCIGLLLARGALAGRPMSTDDAAVTPAGECQLQSWLQRESGTGELWLLPACSPLDRLELTAGGAHAWDRRSASSSQWSVQAKFLLREQHPGEWGAALSVGWSRRDAAAAEDRIEAQPLNLVATYRASDSAWLLHANAGFRRDLAHNRRQGTWAVAYERAPDARFGGFVEWLDAVGDDPIVQGGLRCDVVPGKISLNVTFGASWRSGLHRPFASIGMNL